MMFGVTNIGDAKKAKELGRELQTLGFKFFPINMEKSSKVFQGWNHITVTFDNVECVTSLTVNGHFVGVI